MFDSDSFTVIILFGYIFPIAILVIGFLLVVTSLNDKERRSKRKPKN